MLHFTVVEIDEWYLSSWTHFPTFLSSATQTVEKFFSKDIKYLVSNKREARYVQCLRQDSPVPSPESGHSSPHPRSNSHQPGSQRDDSKSRTRGQTDAVSSPLFDQQHYMSLTSHKCSSLPDSFSKYKLMSETFLSLFSSFFVRVCLFDIHVFVCCFAVCRQSREVFGWASSERAGLLNQH